MQRREFARTLLLGAGVACTLGTPASRLAFAANATRRLHAQLAREHTRDGVAKWIPVAQCVGEACAPASRLRIDIESIDFMPIGEALVVDAIFETHAGPRPFRIASFQPGGLSPLSKPFSFEAAHTSLAGFRGELGSRDGDSLRIGGVAVAGPAHPALVPGRYRLALARGEVGPTADASSRVATLTFSVVDPSAG